MNKIKFNIKSVKEILKIRSVRFSKYAEGKARLNLYYMLISSAAGLIISTLMLLPTPFFLAELSPSPARLMFYPVFLASGIFSAIARSVKLVFYPNDVHPDVRADLGRRNTYRRFSESRQSRGFLSAADNHAVDRVCCSSDRHGSAHRGNDDFVYNSVAALQNARHRRL